jgi:hypothetical protein
MEERLKTYLERQRGEADVEVHARAHTQGGESIVVAAGTIVGIFIVGLITLIVVKFA